MSETLRKYGAKYNTTYCEFCGLSTDAKPVTSFGGINIANGSKFVEMDSNKEFRYDADAKVWHEVTDGGSGGGGSALFGIPILATPTALAHDNNSHYVLQWLYDGKTSITIPNTYSYYLSGHKLYHVIMKPISSISFEYSFGGGMFGNIIFTALNDNIKIKCYKGTDIQDVKYEYDSPIKIGDFKEGKTYCVYYWTDSGGSATNYTTYVNVTEYDEPITFTLE